MYIVHVLARVYSTCARLLIKNMPPGGLPQNTFHLCIFHIFQIQDKSIISLQTSGWIVGLPSLREDDCWEASKRKHEAARWDAHWGDPAHLHNLWKNLQEQKQSSHTHLHETQVFLLCHIYTKLKFYKTSCSKKEHLEFVFCNKILIQS